LALARVGESLPILKLLVHAGGLAVQRRCLRAIRGSGGRFAPHSPGVGQLVPILQPLERL
jgi:hypothetical protein